MTAVEIAIAVLIILGVAAIVVAVAGMALSREVFAMLLYGSIPGGFAAACFAIAAGLSQPPGVADLQLFVLFLTLAISGAVGGHRIAAAAASRERRRQSGSAMRRRTPARWFERLPLIGSLR